MAEDMITENLADVSFKESKGATVVSTLEVPFMRDTDNVFPQLWPRSRFDALQRQAPGMLPYCSLSGETPLPEGPEGDIAVVVCYVKGQESTAMMSNHLAQWELPFTDCLRFAMKNLQKITKGEGAKKTTERWTLHPSGCATSQWLDGSDSARVALMPSVAASRKRAEGDEGGAVALFASHHIALHVGSKNPLGLCYAGDITNVQVPYPIPNLNYNPKLRPQTTTLNYSVIQTSISINRCRSCSVPPHGGSSRP